jgi:hypothetical protein
MGFMGRSGGWWFVGPLVLMMIYTRMGPFTPFYFGLAICLSTIFSIIKIKVEKISDEK